MRLWGKKLDNDDILNNFYTKKKQLQVLKILPYIW